MNKKIVIYIAIAILLLGGSAYLYFSNLSYEEDYIEETPTEEIAPISDEDLKKYMQEENSKVEDVTTEEENSEEKIIEEKEYDTSPGTYIDYSTEAYNRAIQNRKVVLFFHAVWCPTCKEANNNFEQNLDQIPDGVTLLKVDYDTEAELKKEYGITYQHTFVQLDEDGSIVSRWAGGDIEELQDNLK